jgi:hypothetical protein
MTTHDFSDANLAHIVKLALEVDKPLLFDYFLPSISRGCKIGQTGENNEKILFKSRDENTSPLIRLLKVPSLNNPGSCGQYLVCETQNSLYVVHKNILNK